MGQSIENQQDYDLNNNQLQVIISGILGDGHIYKTKNKKGVFTTNCIHKEYLEWKKELLGEISHNISECINQGFKQNIIYALSCKKLKILYELSNLSLSNQLGLIDELGLALWFYDDGSLHKKNHFFNLNTHSFSEDAHYNILVPFFENLGMKPKVFKDRKKDGREFSYLYFGKHFGAFEIMKILEKHKIDCYKYKLWSSETIQKWSKLKVELKSRDIEVSPRKFTNILNGVSSI